jgi:hypothetical protein
MATEKFTAATDRGDLLTTQLDALADGAQSVGGTELDNATNKDRWAVAVLNVDTASATDALAVAELFQIIAPDGTNYEDATVVAELARCATFQFAAVATAQRMVSNPFRLRGPFKTKFILKNRSGEAFPASGSTVEIHTFNRDIS